MPDVGSVASSTASGAAAGTAILPGWGTAIGAGVGLVGGLLSGEGTADSQKQQNRAQAQAAAQQSAQSFINSLTARGTNIQQIIAHDPRGAQFWQDQYQQSVARGDHRDFQTWFVAAIQAAPSDQIWDVIASPKIDNGAANWTLPDSVQINGQAAQPVIANQATKLFSDQQQAQQAAQAAAVAKQWGTTGNAGLKAQYDSDPGYAAMYGSFDNFALADFNANATPQQKQAILGQAQAQAGGVNPTTLTGQQASVNQNITNLLNGTTLASNLAGLQPALDANTKIGQLQEQLITEQRGANTNINTVQLAGLQDLLNTRTTGATGVYDATVAGAHGVSDASLEGLRQLLAARTTGANDIYGATVTGAGGVRDAATAAAQGISTADLAGLAKLLGVQETGARDVYGAQLKQADTYAQSANEAASRQLAEQQAIRARQGFTGTSSGSDLERARLLSTAIQAGAGARAGAGVSLEQALANSRQSNSLSQLQDAINLATGVGTANTGYASNVANAGVGRATNIAGANEQNSIGQLNTGVNLANSLAGAGTTRATTVAGANEQLAAGRLGANTQLATSNAGLLDTNGKIAVAQADFQNAMAKLNLTLQGQQQQIGASGLPNANASGTLSLQTQQAQAAYDNLTALMKTLGPLTINQASGPGVVSPNPGPVLNSNQILGGALTNAGTAVGNQSSTDELIKLVNRLLPSSGSAGTTGAASANPYPLGQTPVFRVGTGGIFTGPG